MRAAAPDIEPSGFFVLRTPLMPSSDLTSLSGGLEAPRAQESGLAEALAKDRSALRARLAQYVRRPEVLEALFVASPSLEESIASWLRDPESERGQRVERALVRYVARLAGRATPFGLFAGCSVGTIGCETHLEIAGRSEYRRHTRLDTDYLFALCDALGRDPALRAAFAYRPNSSLYRSGDRLHYVESRLAGTRRTYHLVAVELGGALEAVLAQARDAVRFEALVAAMADDGVSSEEAAAYVGELIGSQILVPDVSVPVTGPEPVHVLADELAGRAETAWVSRSLAEARRAIAEIDVAGLGVATDRYRDVARSLEALPAKVELARLFQVDLTKPAPRATLGGEALAQIVAGVELMRRLARPVGDESLDRFREAFRRRYEEREVPLVQALDEEAGIGFGGSGETAPLLQDVPLAPTREEEVPWGRREALLLRRLNEALSEGRMEMALEPEDLGELTAREPLPLPNAFAVTATIAAASEDALRSGDFRVVLGGFFGPSGAPLLGRFCHADETLGRFVRGHLRAEEARDPDAVFAEIVHLPEGRLGNILLRPVLREYEIAYLGRSGAAAEGQIPITDLTVSVRADRIVLRSERLQRRVIPRLTTAHNFALGSLGVYRFLCALQRQGVAGGPGWDWGPLKRAPFLPRVVHGRLLLSRARWRLHNDELKRLGRGDAVARFRELKAWRVARRVPRWVALADGDNTLPVDLENALAVESFVHLVKDRDEATLEELFPVPDQQCAHGPEGRFVHELIVPFVLRAPASAGLEDAPAKPVRRLEPQPDVRRTFPPGSEWLYVKLYTGPATADRILRELVGPMVRRALRARLADRWFFIRYADPEFHLRLRLRGVPETLQREVWPMLRDAAAPFLHDRGVWRLTLDTYEREIERYGGPAGIELAEQLFHADSEAVLAIVERLDPGDAGHDERWRLAFCGMHFLLEDLGLDLGARTALLGTAAQGLAKDLRIDRKVEHWIGDRFRSERSSLGALLDPAREHDSPLAPGLRALRRRSRRWRPALATLKAHEAAGRLSAPCQQLARSYLHMHANRQLRSASRLQEAVLYDLLARHYEAAMARERRQTAPVTAATHASAELG